MDDYRIVNADEIPTPALVVYRDFVTENIRHIGDMLGGYGRLRPHIKTHKMSRIMQMEMDVGIDKFKCATPKEAAVLAAVGAVDILIAYHIIGPAIDRVVGIVQTYPHVDLKVIADDAGAVEALSEACTAADVPIGVVIDLDPGMHRTGIFSPDVALSLARTVDALPGLTLEGLHVYDGHVGDFPDLETRRQTARESIDRALEVRRALEGEGLPVKALIASGSPGFESTLQMPEVDEVSPGTWIFWDVSYQETLQIGFRWAALILSRVISTPGPDLITLDAGSKSISPDTPPPSFQILGLPDDIEFLRRNEEHQVIRISEGTPRPSVGDVLYLVPRHICPTVNLWDEACVVDGNGRFVETWPVDARGH